ncbi:hypothetical protein [Treponema pectinovorum]|uniref:hypothetical protein n=1 Tax=Treponema pectinovorum TaxID=164 RepID=UPI0011CC82D4|nr:hypothetical protein [Treponema pectinovorum]
MLSSKKYNRFDTYLLKGKLKRNGFEHWRYVFTGINKSTGEQRAFFVELYYVNPLVSPKEPVLSQKSQLKISDSDLQYALAGTISAENVSQEVALLPSYALVKAGAYGKDGRQFNSFNPASSLVHQKNEKNFKVGSCIFGADVLLGEVELLPQEVREHPEYLCASGRMKWNLHFEKNIESPPLCANKTNFWIPIGAKTVFAGTVELDGQEYSVVPRNSSGYIDKSWGVSPANPFYHLSSSNLTSLISGKPLTKSCFSLEGEFDKKLSVFIKFEGQRIALNANSFFDKYSEIHTWSQMPVDADGEKLHWTISIHRKKYVIDLDLYCKTSEMFVRDYEIPQGERSLLKVLGGGSGFGEIKIFRKVKKNLELIEHANVLDCICEYGSVDKGDE